jgi:hypothetical protein
MLAAWQDHHHARDQTWHSLQIEAVLAAGLVSLDAQFGSRLATLLAGVLVMFSACFGIWITLNHRKLERRKFIHIMNCEELLGLHRDDLIPLQLGALADFGMSAGAYSQRVASTRNPALVTDAAVTVPRTMSLWDTFNLRVHNTAVFILRMHVALMTFAAILIAARMLSGPK